MEFDGAVEKGMSLARTGQYAEALRIFDEELCFTQHPSAMSYYAMCLASTEGNYDKAISLCLTAAEREFYNPEIYLNLGRILLLNGQKSSAIKAFRKGLKFDDMNADILKEIKRLGVRRKPFFPFLPRESALNRFVGGILSGKARLNF